MSPDYPFRPLLLIGTLALLPFLLYHRLRSQSTREKLHRRQEGPFILLTLRPIGLAGAVAYVTYLASPSRMAWSTLPLPTPLRYLGLTLALLAALLLAWTFHTLGPNLTDTVVTRKQHALVTTGPFRFVRNPFYDAVLLLTLGVSLAAANWFLLLAGSTVFTLQVLRTRTEEQHLLARFGDDYRTYMSCTGRFLPRLAQKQILPAATSSREESRP